MVMNESAHETDGSIKSEHNTKYMLKFINCVVPLCLGIWGKIPWLYEEKKRVIELWKFIYRSEGVRIWLK